MNTEERARRLLQANAERHVAAWIRHPAVRPTVESDAWRTIGHVALEPLERVVGPLSPWGVYWLMLRALHAREDAPAQATPEPPEWDGSPEADAAARGLLVAVDRLGEYLRGKGVKLSIEGLANSDRVVLAQLICLAVEWDSPDGVVRDLNVGSNRWLMLIAGGVSVGSDMHGGDDEDRAINVLARRQRGQIRSYKGDRKRKYDLDAILASLPEGWQQDIPKAHAAVIEALNDADKWPDEEWLRRELEHRLAESPKPSE